MMFVRALGLAAAAAIGLIVNVAPGTANNGAPQYDVAGRLVFPDVYRDWVFLSSSLDMSYVDGQPPPGAHIFSNVFVPREAYLSFVKKGVWPDKTILLTEHRVGATNLPSLKQGQIQTTSFAAFEAHVKDSRFKGSLAFFGFGTDGKSAGEIPHDATCYSCHEQHAAADTTFVQFYPTLLPVATALKTLNPSYVSETSVPGSK